jgi:hypothetical protein
VRGRGGRVSPACALVVLLRLVHVIATLTAIGPILGGALLRLLPDQLGSFLGQEIRDYHVLFALSMFGCLVSVHLLDLVHEAEAHPPETVWRTMRSMRAFNPVLIAQSAAQLILTPVGLVALARQSVRTLRKQARQITDVGDDLVESTTEAIRPTRRDPPEKESP